MKILEIILTLAISVYAAVVATKWKELNYIKRSAVLIGVILPLIIAWNKFEELQKENMLEKVNAKLGEIVDKSKVKIPFLEIGNSGTIYTAGKDSKNGSSLFDGTDKSPIFKSYIENNRLYVYAILRDENSKTIALIDGNTWKVFSDDFEYNNDKSAFELVTNGERQVYFHLYFDKDTIHMEGIFFGKSKNGMGLMEDSGSAITALYYPDAPLDIHNTGIKTQYFKYPREKFIGIRNK